MIGTGAERTSETSVESLSLWRSFWKRVAGGIAAGRRRREEERQFRAAVAQGTPMRIVVGSAGIVPPGWIGTEQEFMNLLSREHWTKNFAAVPAVAILAEHVWEHLTPEAGLQAAKYCHEFLQPGGHVRIAVPDGYSPDPEYIEWVRVGGTGAGADDHKVLYNHQTLSGMLKTAGFSVELLEYYDRDGKFHRKEWLIEDGMIHRSSQHDERNAGGTLRYTSLIVDARKTT